MWNIAYMGRYVWAIAIKNDNAWIRWISSIYIHHESWWEYTPNQGISWYCKKTCYTRDVLKHHFSSDDLTINTYLFCKQIYLKMVEDHVHVHWDKLVWNRLSTPKHRFIYWLDVQNKLQITYISKDWS